MSRVYYVKKDINRRMSRMKWTSKKYGLKALVLIEFLIILTILRHYVRDVDLDTRVRATRKFGGLSPRVLSNCSERGTINAGVPAHLQELNCSLVTLKETPTPRIVYQILYGNVFTFRNYLSILSVYKILKPYRILLYVPGEFKPEPLEYNMWFQKTADLIPYLEVIYHSGDIGILNGIRELRHIVATELNRTGGIYVNLNTVINIDIWKQADSNIRMGIAGNSSIGFVQVAQNFNLSDFVQNMKVFDDLKMKKNFITECVFPYVFKGDEQCCIIPHIIYPMDIMRNESHFASYARLLFYGTSLVAVPQRSFPPIPKVVHYVWFGTRHMTYTMYLSFQSTLRFVKPIQIIIYVESFDLGRYFDAMKNLSVVRVVYYGRPKSVFQIPINKLSHISDYVRADVLLRLGGIYCDWDVFWLKPVDDLLTLGYETIAALDPVKQILDRQDFPDLINMGVLLARPGSRFIALWLESFHKYIGKHATFHAVEMVYKLYEDHPGLLYLEETLQVLCFPLDKCHPLWLPNYQEANVHNEFDFTKDAYTVHITGPMPKAFKSKKGIRKSEGFFADMARHIHGA